MGTTSGISWAGQNRAGEALSERVDEGSPHGTPVGSCRGRTPCAVRRRAIPGCPDIVVALQHRQKGSLQCVITHCKEDQWRGFRFAAEPGNLTKFHPRIWSQYRSQLRFVDRFRSCLDWCTWAGHDSMTVEGLRGRCPRAPPHIGVLPRAECGR